jgi:hypothetical protein
VDFGDAPAESCECPTDGHEEDDIPEQAVILTLGDRKAHDFCDDAVDWTVFAAWPGEVYTITTFSWGGRVDTVVSLCAPDGSTLLAASDDYEGTTDYSSQLVWTAPAIGAYYLRTSNRAGLTGCATEYELWLEHDEAFTLYLPLTARVAEATISVTIRPAGIITHTCPDSNERDDTWQEARAIEDGMAQVRSFDSDSTCYAAD